MCVLCLSAVSYCVGDLVLECDCAMSGCPIVAEFLVLSRNLLCCSFSRLVLSVVFVCVCLSVTVCVGVFVLKTYVFRSLALLLRSSLFLCWCFVCKLLCCFCSLTGISVLCCRCHLLAGLCE